MDNRRRQLFVKEGDHRGLLAGALVLILVLILVASGLFYILADRDLEEATYKAHFQTLRSTMQMLLPWLVIVNLVGLVVVLTLAVFLTHRVSGPAYHLIRDLRRLKEGDLTVETRFRKNDRLKGVAEAMSDGVGQVRQKVGRVKDAFRELECLSGTHPELQGKLDKIRETLDELKT